MMLLTLLCCAALQEKPIFVEGYPDRWSVQAGDDVALHVSSSTPAFSIEISRVGAESPLVLRKEGVKGGPQPVPDNASTHGCAWPAAFKLTIPPDWKSGYYNVRLSVSDNGGEFVQRGRRTAESHAFFVVRAAQPGRDARILLQLATNTYNAYNNWGGTSVYAYHGRNKVQGRRVSIHRPQASQYSNWERPFVAWAESNGFALEFATNNDLEFRPDLLKAYKLVLSVGHDEYWSSPMRDAADAYIGAGGNVAFFSGNTCCWQIRNEEGGNAFTCWKQAFKEDPLFAGGDLKLLSTLWSHHLVARPENQLTGTGFLWGGYHRSHGQLMNGSGAFKVHRPEHWIFAGSGLKSGEEFGGKDTIVGYECDGCEIEWRDGLPFPTGRDGTPKNFEILGTAPAIWHPDDCEWYERWEKGRQGNAVLGSYTRGGTVVSTGTTDWSHGLRGNDPAVVRITRNILEKLGR